MSRTFDIKRFCQLVRHDVRSCPKGHIFAGLWMATLFTPLMVLTTPLFGGDKAGTLYRIIMMGGMIASFSLMLPSAIYLNVGKKKRGIYFAMLPATKAEKHLSMATVMLLVSPVTLLAIGLILDTILTAVHLPGYDKYFWQSTAWQSISPQMVIGAALAFVGSVFGSIFANTFQQKGLRYIIYGLAGVWLMVGLLALPAISYIENDTDAYWYVIAAEVVLALLFAWLSRHKMDKMEY